MSERCGHLGPETREGHRNNSPTFLLPNQNKGERPMTLEDSVQAQRLNVFRRAEELRNVSAACREAGISRPLFYRWKWRYERYGVDGLHPKRTTVPPGRPPCVTVYVERAVLAMDM